LLVPSERVATRKIGLEARIGLASIVQIGRKRQIGHCGRRQASAAGERIRPFTYFAGVLIKQLRIARCRAKFITFGRGHGSVLGRYDSSQAKRRDENDSRRVLFVI
jgi:hypothetical protein